MLLSLLAVLLQLVAAVQAFRIGRVTERRWPWLLIGLAIFLMVFSRLLTVRLRLEDPDVWILPYRTLLEVGVTLLLVIGLEMLVPVLGRTRGVAELERRSLQAEARFRQIVETTLDGVWTIDPAGTTTYVNRRMAELLGYTPGEMLGRPMFDFMEPGVRAVAEQNLARRASGIAEQHDFPWRHRDGHAVWTMLTANPLTDAEGRYEGALALITDITARRQQEQALRESEARARHQAEEFRSLLDVVPAIVWIAHDREARRIEGNRAAHELLRIPPGGNLSTTAPGADAPHHFRMLQDGVELGPESLPVQRGARGEAIEGFEATILFEDGEARTLYGGVRPLRDEAGEARGAVAAFTDITALRAAEAALRESEERFRQFAEQSPDVFWFIQLAPVRRVLYVSPAYAEIWGRPAARLLADPLDWLTGIHPEDRPGVEGAWAAQLDPAGPVPYDLEYRVVRATDGAVRWVRDRGTLIHDAQGQVVRVCGIATDITARRRTAAAEREGARRLKLLVDASPLPIVSLLPDGIVAGWNPAAERTFGWAADEVLGRPLPIVPGELQAEFRTAMIETLAGTGIHGRATRRRTRDGTELAVQMYTAPLRSAEGDVTGVVAIYEDITERLRIERMNQLFHERLLEAQKLESIGVLAGGIAHDFNNLLTMILGNAHLARADLPPDAPAQPALQQIEQATQRAAELTAQMLAYAGKGRFVSGPVEVTALVEANLRLLQAALPVGARLDLDLAGPLPAIEGDPTQLRQVLLVLVTNAGEALPGGKGTVTVRTGVEDLDRAYLLGTTLPPSLREGRYVYLEVADTGPGITPEVQARMFEPFYSTKFSGRGLGLAAALGITRSHHGSIRVESAPGRGTRMRVLLPVSPAPVRPRPGGGAAAAEVRPARVLIVDDEEDVLRLLRTFLERAGYEVDTAATGGDAVARVRAQPQAFAAVVLDLTMPGMTGDEALGEIRRVNPEVPVILTSGYSEEEVVRRCAGLAFSAFLPKPYLPAELIEEVRRATTARRPGPGCSPPPAAR